MQIGLFILSMGGFGNKGFYNLQEVGLAKALDKICEKVRVYKLVSETESFQTEKIEGTEHTEMYYLPSKKIGTNGIPDMSAVDTELDALVCFSDTQLMLPKAYSWAKKHNIRFLPYIGVTESHSTSKLKSLVIDLLFVRNVRVYKRCVCLAKTPTVKKSLEDKGIANVEVCPVGLDLTLLKEDYEDYSPIELKAKYGYQADDKVVLFIGRLIDEKRPLDMLEIFKELTARNDAYKLLMVGTGELKDAVKAKIKQLGLEEKVTMRERIPNSDIWELYRFADTFVNLNRQEIFGMAILEAMYYGCKVVAWHAPGPDFIITDKETGYLVSDNSQAVEAVVAPKNVGIQSHKRIINEFTWDKTAEKVRNII